MKTYYLYRHIRDDKNIPFYIGIGTIQPSQRGKNKFNRAYTKIKRNRYWKNVTNKTSYTVDIVFISDDLEFIKLKEIEFIDLYKRKDDGGILCNFSVGGESGHGVKPSESELNRRSKFFKEYWKLNINPKSNRIYRYDLNGELLSEHQSIRQAGKDLNICYRALGQFLKDSNKTFIKHNCFFSRYKLTPKDVINEIKKRMEYKRIIGDRQLTFENIYQYDLELNLVKIWVNIRNIIEDNPTYKPANLRCCLNGNSKTAYGYKWSTSMP